MANCTTDNVQLKEWQIALLTKCTWKNGNESGSALDNVQYGRCTLENVHSGKLGHSSKSHITVCHSSNVKNTMTNVTLDNV
jgi:hypothetical protein